MSTESINQCNPVTSPQVSRTTTG